MVDNDEDRDHVDQIRTRLIDWIFLPLPLAFVVLGVGILTGLLFKENVLLTGSLKIVFGLALLLYGLVRSSMIIRKLLGKKKDRLWIKKY
jgi:hypothetical protein